MTLFRVVVDDPTLPRYECQVRTHTKTGARLEAARLALQAARWLGGVAPQLERELEEDGEGAIESIGAYARASIVDDPGEKTRDEVHEEYMGGYFATKVGEPEAEPTDKEREEAEVAFERFYADYFLLCDRCGKPNFMRQPMLEVGGGAKICSSCFAEGSRTANGDTVAA